MSIEPAKRGRVLFIIWISLIHAALVYGLLGWQSDRTRHSLLANAAEMTSLAERLSYLVPLVALLVGFALYRRIGGVEEGVVGSMDPGGSIAARFSKLQSGMIVMLVLFEAVAIVGLVLFFLGAPLVLLYRFVGATVVLMVLGGMRVRTDYTRLKDSLPPSP